ncbi:MAG: hypothetical protein A2092_16030 [Rhodobacteraceae bacterium GWE1_64_9]|nr:MAG: hypothetical protein A2092_16030 [Rhodobacteraceae bacterium GWE1_64_9]OHC50444.1 MAG: hypothetical protein A2X69_19670 [Rhodobacteraceae bacterium GWF1_65_7]HBD91728.1 hypothetical protein [Gemmobacter sp.]HBU16425.1 hypothetical protein [Gemmobacter sp.]
MKFFHVLTLSAALAVPMAPMAFAADTPVESVKVEADVTSIANEKAAKFWGNLSTDLQAAILARVQDRIADKGSRITVDIDEVSLANSFETSMGLEDSILMGRVNVSSDDNSKFDVYEMTVSVETARQYLPEGYVMSDDRFTDSPEHYAAMIAAFADNVVAKLK